jgi:hypothetical protein
MDDFPFCPPAMCSEKRYAQVKSKRLRLQNQKTE